MKKLHKLVFKTFFGPFIATFVISNFLLLMIWMVKYLEDIIGKGLDFSIIMEMIARGSLNQIPFSLPLAVLLSSTMTYGKLGETIELTAMKSLGVSLTRAMQPLFLFCFVLSIGAYYFTNDYLPHSNKKLGVLIGDITKTKPELMIPEGVFYSDLKGYTIRIGKKYEDKTISDVLIFDDSNDGQGGFIASDSGKLELSADGNFLILNLIDGNTYKRDKEKSRPGKFKRLPFVRNEFKNNRLAFDLSGFGFEKSDPSSRGKSLKNMPNNLLLANRDSVIASRFKEANKTEEYLYHSFLFRPDSTFISDTVSGYNLDTMLTKLASHDSLKQRIIYKVAKEFAGRAKARIMSTENAMNNTTIYINRHTAEIHKKYSMALACLIMFFIGAPFGAIVRKGGLGLPVVIGVILFLLYYVVTTTMYKVVKKGDFDPILGMWLSPIILTPIGIFLTYKATTDSDLFRMEVYKKFFKNIFQRK